MRIGAHEMAAADMIGSNPFNFSVIFLNDALYRRGDIFSSVGSSPHLVAAAAIAAMTFVVLAALIFRSRRKLAAGLSWYSYMLILLFCAGAWLNFSSK